MEINCLARKTSPLCFLPSGNLVCYKNGDILIFNKNKIIEKIPIFKNFREKVLGRVNLIFRVLRLGIRCAIAISENVILFSVGNTIYELNLSKKRLSNGYSLERGIRPLNFSNIEDIDNFDNGVYFGGYMQNCGKNEVFIYQRTGEDRWIVKYQFPQGEINHVHNIIPDPYRKCVWVLTGDFDSSAAIWKTTDNFKTLNRVLFGKQDYRACVAFVIPEGLVYATDTPYSQNYVYLLNNEGEVKKISKIAGSCIYGCKCSDNLVFATTIEPDGRNQTILSLIFNYKIGSAIHDKYARIYVGKNPYEIRELLKIKKDFYPFIFQFGTFKFPAGINNSKILYFQPVSLNQNDLDLMFVRI